MHDSGIVHHSYLDSGRLQIIHDGCYLRTDNVRWDRAYSLNPIVFCAVTAVMTEAAYPLSAEIVLISACMPAPPEQSEPAMVRMTGIVDMIIKCLLVKIKTPHGAIP